MKSLGVALGGGGARGLAHMLALEVIDGCGLRPAALAGTSMGAIIGALYAAGLSGAQMRKGLTQRAIGKGDRLKDIFSKSGEIFKWLQGVRPAGPRGGLLKAEGALRSLLAGIRVSTFEELSIPLSIVTTDFWTGEQVVFSQGELLPALQATMAIPGVFAPVELDGRVLVDGGLVNNVPFDLLAPVCDCTVAIDVAPVRKPGRHRVPGVMESVLGMFDMLIERNIAARLAAAPPAVYIRPGFSNIALLDFHKHAEVFRQAEPAMGKLREELQRSTSNTQLPTSKLNVER